MVDVEVVNIYNRTHRLQTHSRTEREMGLVCCVYDNMDFFFTSLLNVFTCECTMLTISNTEWCPCVVHTKNSDICVSHCIYVLTHIVCVVWGFCYRHI